MIPQDGAPRGKSNLVTKKLNASVRKRLSKYIDELIDRGYMSYQEESTLNLSMNEVIVKSNMLHREWNTGLAQRFIAPTLSQ